ncbi:MAG: hypothetical protein LQ346_003709 [Caloplaca aetnensis]|nr:MAG: hypothetical protein LQ346_003709 [Caloplaca aetnensis]
MDSNIALDSLREERASEPSNDHDGLRRRFVRSRTESLREYTLPEADRGKHAWLFLAGCFMVEALIWGFPFSFGVFQEYYTTHEPFSLHPSGIAAIGTSSTGIMYLSCPLLFAAFKRWPQIRRSSLLVGLVINTLAIVASSFATAVSHLILTQVSKFIERNPSVAADNHSLPTYAKSLGMTGTQGTLMLALINMGVVFGAMSAGALNDRMHVSSVMALCSIGAAGAVFLFWGLSVSLPMLCVFSLLYGLTAGGFSANYTGIVQRVKESDAAADSGMIFGFLAAGRGIGAVASGPLSEALLHMQMWKGEAKLGYGTGYGLLIVFTGITAAVGGTNWLLRRIGFT